MASVPEAVASGLWVVRGGLPRHGMNVFFVQEPDGVACFDTGSREMADQLCRLAAPLGGVSRIVLSHAHPDHRGAARQIGAPVWCHPDEVRDVEGDGGRHYWARQTAGRARDRWRGRLMSALRDGGPVAVDGTVAPGDLVGDFRVIHLPGHAPGQIGLWRAADRTVLVGDCFHSPSPGLAELPKQTYNHDAGLTVASVEAVAALRPACAWPGHGPALQGDVAEALNRALAAHRESAG